MTNNRIIGLDLDIEVTGIKQFIAELFLLEMNKKLEALPLDMKEDNKPDDVYILCNGNGGRNYQREVISVEKQSQLVGFSYKNLQKILLSRNGIYHSLPEALFHPLTLGNSFSTVDDIIESIRKNQRDTVECKKFFSLFDNQFFKYKAALLKRQLEWPYNGEYFVRELVQSFFDHDLEHTQEQALILLSSIGFHEDIKGDYDLQASLLSLLINEKITIKEVKYFFENSGYRTLGSGVMGLDVGLSGKHSAELNDIQIDIWLKDSNDIEKNILNKKQDNYIRGIMSLFTFSARKIHIRYQLLEKDFGITLGKDGYLGVNTAVA